MHNAFYQQPPNLNEASVRASRCWRMIQAIVPSLARDEAYIPGPVLCRRTGSESTHFTAGFALAAKQRHTKDYVYTKTTQRLCADVALLKEVRDHAVLFLSEVLGVAVPFLRGHLGIDSISTLGNRAPQVHELLTIDLVRL